MLNSTGPRRGHQPDEHGRLADEQADHAARRTSGRPVPRWSREEAKVEKAKEAVAVQRQEAAPTSSARRASSVRPRRPRPRSRRWSSATVPREAQAAQRPSRRPGPAARPEAAGGPHPRADHRAGAHAARWLQGRHRRVPATDRCPGAVTSPFGYRRHPIYGYWGLHDGTDFSAPCGTPNRAAGSGTVISRYWSDVYGNRLYLDLGQVNGKNMTVVYNHLSGYTASTGERVSRGEVVGYGGHAPAGPPAATCTSPCCSTATR